MLKNKTIGHIALLIALGCLVSQAWAKPIRVSKTEASPIGKQAKKTSPTPIPASPQDTPAPPRQERQPHPVPPQQTASIGISSLTLYSGGSLNMGGLANVTGSVAGVNSVSLAMAAGAGDIYSETCIYLGVNSHARGNVWANDKVSLEGISRVDGNVTTQGKYLKAASATVTGQTVLGRDATLLVLPSMDTASDSGKLGRKSIWEGRNTTTDLASGSYKTVGFDRNATLNLSAGTYTMKSFSMERDGLVNVDTSSGDVILNVHSGFAAGDNVVFNTLGDGDLFVNVFDKNVKLDNNVTMDATVRVFKGKFAAGTDANLTGTFHASSDITLGQGSQVTYGSAGGAVPEPATIALLSCGGAMCILRKYRRK